MKGSRSIPDVEIKHDRIQDSHLVRPLRLYQRNPRVNQIANPILHQQQDLRNQAILRFTQSCPLSLSGANMCPFGDVCHTCPVRMQTKLTIVQTGDKYDQKVNRLAERVMHMPEPQSQEAVNVSGIAHTLQIQRKRTKNVEELLRQPIEEEEDLNQAKLAEGTRVQRQEYELEEEEEKLIQAKRTGRQTLWAAPGLDMQVRSLRGRGQPLPQSVRSLLEARFGVDFGQVRVHTGSQAAELARTVNARAFTVGRDVVFGDGQYAPVTAVGKRLLAHELTHVLQQKTARCQRRKNLSLFGNPLLPIFATPCPSGIWIQRQPVINAHPATSSVIDIDHSKNPAQIGVIAGVNIAYGLTHHRIQIIPIPDTSPRARGGRWEVALWSVEIFPYVDNTIYVNRGFPFGSCPYRWTLDHEAGYVLDSYVIMLRHRRLLINDLRAFRPEPNNPTVVPNAAQARLVRQRIRARVATLADCAKNQACYDMYRSDYARDVREYPRAFARCPAPRPQVPPVPPRGRVVVQCRPPPLGCPRPIRVFP